MQKGSKFFISGEGMVYRVLSCKAVKRLWFGGDESKWLEGYPRKRMFIVHTG